MEPTTSNDRDQLQKSFHAGKIATSSYRYKEVKRMHPSIDDYHVIFLSMKESAEKLLSESYNLEKEDWQNYHSKIDVKEFRVKLHPNPKKPTVFETLPNTNKSFEIIHLMMLVNICEYALTQHDPVALLVLQNEATTVRWNFNSQVEKRRCGYNARIGHQGHKSIWRSIIKEMKKTLKEDASFRKIELDLYKITPENCGPLLNQAIADLNIEETFEVHSVKKNKDEPRKRQIEYTYNGKSKTISLGQLLNYFSEK